MDPRPVLAPALFLATGGLALFILGLFTLRAGLSRAVGGRVAQVVQATVQTPWRGFATGIAATLATQSSAVVTILSMGLVSAGTIAFEDVIAVILGANIGSTFTVGLLSLNPERFGPWLLLLAAAGYIAAPRAAPPARVSQVRNLSLSLAGFATLFVGYAVLKTAARPLGTAPEVAHWLLAARQNPWFGVLAGTLVTAAVGSSSATTALCASLAESGALPLTGAIAIVFGNNLGTCVTAVLASIGGTRPVQRVAATHVLLNASGAVAFTLVIGPFASLIRALPASPEHQVIAAHILFNVLSSLAALPFVSQIGTVLNRILPERTTG